ncbi:MAG: 2-hydroxychromene-2-carboxylate isomerase [Myxococcales bacterium]|nr:2-hydroxychromene-2-carboxylate isomerase [Myxococcales bacterium]
MAQLEFFYDCSSPWTYLAFHKIEEIAAASDTELLWRPILVGGVFNAVNQNVYSERANPSNERRARYMGKDLADWARSYGLAISFPKLFPVNSVKAMRGCFVAEDRGCISAFSRAVFAAYWGDHRDIAQDDVLTDISAGVGLDPGEFLERIAQSEIKAKLRATTDDLIARGGFGSPTMFVDGDDMYFGNDRLPLVAEALAR